MLATALLCLLVLQCTIVKAAGSSQCQGNIQVVESIPAGMNIGSITNSTFQGWKSLILRAQKTIDIAAYYFYLTDGAEWPTEDGGEQGLEIFNLLLNAHKSGVKLRIVQNAPSAQFPDKDSLLLGQLGAAEVRNVNWSQIVSGGILHTKLIVVDNAHFYLGSANMDWTSLTQVKELGFVVSNCTALAADANKIFESYWIAAEHQSLPAGGWPVSVETEWNLENPMPVTLSNSEQQAFISASPQQFCPDFRTHDLQALVGVINEAKEQVCVSVMDYVPATLYNAPNNKYWPNIDDALRSAAFRNVSVRLLVSLWNHSVPIMFQYLRSLDVLEHIEIKLYVVPDMGQPKQIPFTRVNHAKYLVTEKHAYVGTSNWTGDYFIDTAGVSLTVNGEKIRRDIHQIFERDWNSVYAYSLN